MFPSLYAEMARRGVKPKDIAKLLDLNIKTARNKISGKSDLTKTEMWKIRDEFFPSMTIDSLFSTGDSRKNQVS